MDPAGEIDFSVVGTRSTGLDRYIIGRHQDSTMPDWSELGRYDLVESTTGIYRRNDYARIHFDDATPISYARVLEFRDRPIDGWDIDEEVFFVVIQWIYSRTEVSAMLQRQFPRLSQAQLNNILNGVFGNAQYVLSDHYQVLTTENLWGLATNFTLRIDPLFRPSAAGLSALVAATQ